MQKTIQSVQLETPYDIPVMGTSGLRLTQEDYNRPLFLEQFGQGIADYFADLADPTGNTILLGGDPRLGNKKRIKILAQILTAAGFNVSIASDYIASTPAMSHAIRHVKAAGGLILTASHNPFTDVGIKVNMSDGAPALDTTVKSIREYQNSVKEIRLSSFDQGIRTGMITEFNAVDLYADLMNRIMDFQKMRSLINEKKFTACFDTMHGAAGPFAREIFINRLSMNCKILKEEPREDLGGYDESGQPYHPEPDFGYLPELINKNLSGEYDLVAAWDSDVDRRLDGGSGFFLESADEYALFARFSKLIGIENIFSGPIIFCRSTVTAATIDLMQQELSALFPEREVHTVETPTGFKWIAELGNWGVEESNGAGNPYLREKDGIFATLFLLKIMLETGKNSKDLMEELWEDHGRVYFTRGEVSGSNEGEKKQLKDILDNACDSAGGNFGSLKLLEAKSWDYMHPLTKKIAAENAAWELQFSDGNTIKARFSGTGSKGYTLRIYCSKYDKNYRLPKSKITEPMKTAFQIFLEKNGFKGKASHYTDEHQPDPYM